MVQSTSPTEKRAKLELPQGQLDKFNSNMCERTDDWEMIFNKELDKTDLREKIVGPLDFESASGLVSQCNDKERSGWS
jgi:hypothetical protein